jgi:malate/lactate dehydrogenase
VGAWKWSVVSRGPCAKLGRNGVEQVIEITLTAEENAALQRSDGAVRELVEKLKL